MKKLSKSNGGRSWITPAQVFKFHDKWLWACQYGCYEANDYNTKSWRAAYSRAFRHMKRSHYKAG